jgi:LPXTG-motif cell wall-anchored protein
VRDDASAAPGQVRINEDLYTDGDVLDSVAGNNTAKIEVSLSGGSGSGGGLPVTGANAGLFGAAGAALLIAGALGLLLARRRRMRFTA